jgi:hypothetical protein
MQLPRNAELEAVDPSRPAPARPKSVEEQLDLVLEDIQRSEAPSAPAETPKKD